MERHQLIEILMEARRNAAPADDVESFELRNQIAARVNAANNLMSGHRWIDGVAPLVPGGVRIGRQTPQCSTSSTTSWARGARLSNERGASAVVTAVAA
jgi:hypothetical protein